MQNTSLTCASCPSAFTVTESDRAFYEKMSVPPPTLCPDCRQQRRLAWRNERTLYKRKCSATQKDIISTYHQNVPFPVYELSYWWGDKWDAMDHGQEFDFNKSFFEQFVGLQKKVPRLTVLQEQNENSDYTNCVTNLKDCYLLFSSDYDRSCYYGVWIERSNDCIDNLLLDDAELCYDCIFSKKLYHCISCLYSSMCSDSAFLLDCKNCANCFMCYGLRNKQYCLFNKQVTKTEYEEYMKKYPLGSRTNYDYFKNYFLNFIKDAPYLYMRRNGRIENSTGDFLTDTENCEECFEVTEAKDCKYIQGAFQVRDAMDCSYANNEFGYENCECFPMPFNAKFCVNCYSGADLAYCDSCMNNCRNCFGCIGLKQKQYCILNKQYTKEEYEKLVPKIIEHMGGRAHGASAQPENEEALKLRATEQRASSNHKEWGEFFPGNMSPYSYQETVAMDFFPLDEAGAKTNGFRWGKIEEKSYVPQTYVIPDSIIDVPDTISNEMLACVSTGKNYKIIPQELAFYKKMGLPIPHLSPEARHQERAKFRNERRLYDRVCSGCKVSFQSSYAQNRPEKVYCENCYLEKLI